ncbi:hypothetical protein COO91_08667 [Nostoc flagelliforme CCNUN1]|uniref:Uncharacterized protein n=1 Tax=Nostoc flagelliforme CCNUN1 TaxID=2038116 RepID=A0A2K8T497_9NOSO|nr:hypothetical protein COO91_08667 [Nostoc flagelliforme CCNUN1]
MQQSHFQLHLYRAKRMFRERQGAGGRGQGAGGRGSKKRDLYQLFCEMV